jgi:hypothetical protein
MGPLSKDSGATNASSVEEMTVTRLIDFLPASIEIPYFTRCEDPDVTETIFEGFAERRRDAMPKLKRLCFVYGLEDVIGLAEKISREARLEVEIQRYKPATDTEAMEAGYRPKPRNSGEVGTVLFSDKSQRRDSLP